MPSSKLYLIWIFFCLLFCSHYNWYCQFLVLLWMHNWCIFLWKITDTMHVDTTHAITFSMVTDFIEKSNQKSSYLTPLLFTLKKDYALLLFSVFMFACVCVCVCGVCVRGVCVWVFVDMMWYSSSLSGILKLKRVFIYETSACISTNQRDGTEISSSSV